MKPGRQPSCCGSPWRRLWGRRRLILALLAAVIALQSWHPVQAHALLLRSDPAADVILQRSPSIVHLWFSEDLNVAASRIVVWDRYRHPETIGSAFLVPGQPRQLEIRLQHLAPGSYLVLWTSVSAEDGHILHGSYLFSVKKRGPGPSLAGVATGNGQVFPDAPGLAALLAHWIELLAAVAWVGMAVFSAIILPGVVGSRILSDESEWRRLRRWLVLSLVGLFLASTILLTLEGYAEAGNNWSATFTHSNLSSLFAGQYSRLWIVRQLLALVTLVIVVLGGSPASSIARRAPAVATLLGVIYLYIFAASGHAASAHIGEVPIHPAIFSISIALDWLHFLADAVWFGGQFYIVLVLIPLTWAASATEGATSTFLDTLNRFSPAAYASIGSYVVSGLFAAKIHIPSWYAFFQSVYGRTLIVKMVLIGLMMLTSVATVYILRPQLRRLLAGEHRDLVGTSQGPDTVPELRQRLFAWLHVNPVLGLGVLLATSVLFYYPVPAGFAPPGPSSYTAQAHGLVANVTVIPDRSGPNQVTVLLRNRQGKSVTRAHVSVLTTMLDMVMGTGLASLHETSPGTFTGSTDLGMGGHWRLQILVYQPSGLTRMSVTAEVGT